jgi:hypothetical protein
LDHQALFDIGFEVQCIGKQLPSHFDWQKSGVWCV